MGNYYKGVSLPDPEHSSLSTSQVIPFRVPGHAHENPVNGSRAQAYPLQGLGLHKVVVVVVVVVVPPLESQRLLSPLLVTVVADAPVIILNISYND